MSRSASLAVLTVLLSTSLGGCSQDDGAAARPTLNAVEAVGPGDPCPAGGQKILTGVDSNGNGSLEPGEVTQISYVCNGTGAPGCTTLEGSITIRNSFDWTNLVAAGCKRITGRLEIAAEGAGSLGPPSPLVEVGAIEVLPTETLTALDFPALAKVGGEVTISNNPALVRLDLRSLATVGGRLFLADTGLRSVELPALTSVGGEAHLWSSQLARIELPALTTVGEFLSVYEAGYLTTLSVPRLVTAGGVQIGENPALAAVEFPALAEAGTIDIWGLYAGGAPLARLELPVLRTAGGLSVTRTAITRLSLPSLVTLDNAATGHESKIESNPALAAVELPLLTGATDLLISLVTSTATVDVHALTTTTGSLGIGGPGLATIDLSNLTSAGDLSIGGSFTSLDLSRLTSAAGSIRVSVAHLEALSFPALESVGGSFAVYSAATPDDPYTPEDESGPPSVLSAIELPKLVSVHIDLEVYHQPALATLSAPVLSSLGGLRLWNEELRRNTALTALSFPALTSIWWRSLRLGGRGINYLDSSGDLEIKWHAALRSVSLPLLERVADTIIIVRNPVLPQCEVDALVGQLSSGPITALLTGNDTTAVCEP